MSHQLLFKHLQDIWSRCAADLRIAWREAALCHRLISRLIGGGGGFKAKEQKVSRLIHVCLTVMTDLQVPVNYAIYVAVIYTFYNLLYAVTVEERESSSREGGRGRCQETGKRSRKSQ